ncbi:hypothetical protein TrVE_jg13435 [Triparma verrucosa]|uniref:Uncharacterized protein n=1 Tax=Triparma verrucosa TaxID=1606542 RepID=A0A9W7F028_9STRA|nr:hypothetical protein TrVE_jg13435 [Triparma verrucosa]
MNDSLNIYEEYEISSEDNNSTGLLDEDEDTDDDFHEELLAAWKSPGEEEGGVGEGRQLPKTPSAIWRDLPRDLVFRILNSTLPLECRLCSKTLHQAQQAPQRGRVRGHAVSKLCLASSSVEGLPREFVLSSEKYLYNRCSQLLSNLYSSTMRAMLTSLQLVRTSGGSSGPKNVYNDVMEGKISPEHLINGIIDSSINLLGPRQSSEINLVLASRKRDRTILVSRTSAAQAAGGTPWLEECGRCGSAETFYTHRKRKTDIDRYRIVVWCNVCKMAYEL